MPLSMKQFERRLVESGLIDDDELATLRQDVYPALEETTPQHLAKHLVRSRRLTRYQAQTIYQGKLKRLVVGNYQILDKLGEGGMGEVYRASHRVMQREVALKVLPASLLDSPDAVKRFYREVRAAARLEHPNIVTAYDADESDGVHFLVMQCVDGEDLASIVRRNGPMTIEQAVDCCTQAARGLAYAHQKGVIHRDIKPSNLLLDKGGIVQILDMGLARLVDQPSDGSALTGLTHSGQVMGTVDYMAPEQGVYQATVDQRADVYSLGCTLYVLLTAKAPYDGDSIVQKMVAHQQAPIPKLTEHRGDAPLLLDIVLAKALAKEPTDRYESMEAMITDLTRCLSVDEPHAAGALVGNSSDSQLTAFFAGLSDSPTAEDETLEPDNLTAYDQTIDMRDAASDTRRPPVARPAEAHVELDDPQHASLAKQEQSPAHSSQRLKGRSRANPRLLLALAAGVLGSVLLLVAVLALLVFLQANFGQPQMADGSDTSDEVQDDSPVDEGSNSDESKAGKDLIDGRPPDRPNRDVPPAPSSNRHLTAAFLNYVGRVVPANLAVSPSGQHIAVRREGGGLSLLDASSGEIVAQMAFSGDQGASALAYSQDGQFIVMGQGSEVVLLDAATLQRQGSLTETPGEIQAVAMTPDNQFVVFVAKVDAARAENHRAALVWAIEQAKVGVATSSPYASYVAVDPEGEVLIPATNSSFQIFSPRNPKQRRLLKFQGHAATVALTPDGQYLALANRQGKLCLLKFESGEVACELPALAHQSHQMDFSPNGRFLAATQSDEQASLHLIDLKNKEAGALVLQGCPARCVQFSPDSSRFVAATPRGVEVWEVKPSSP